MQSLRLRVPVIVIILASFFCAASSAPAQGGQACALKEAPALHGFRLGMTLTEVKKSLADSSMLESKISTVNAVGSRAVNINGSDLSPENGEGVENVYLTFVDERVAQIKVTYNSAKGWDSPQDFFARESQSLGLPKPAAGALQGSGGNEKYIIECGEFNATLAYAFGVSPNITVANSVARKLVDKRLNKQETGGHEKRTTILPRLPAPAPTPDPTRTEPNNPHPNEP